MRERIYDIIEKDDEHDIVSLLYDVLMILLVLVSFVPLVFKEEYPAFVVLDKVTAVLFIIDYLLRWLTADYRLSRKKKLSPFVRYPFTFMAIVDLLSILPSLSILNRTFKLLRTLRLARALRVLRVFRMLRYSKSLEIIGNVLKSTKKSLLMVCALAAAYIVVSALIAFNLEPEAFGNFFDAIYWATILLTTVGYGDISPVTVLGRGFAMISSFFGVAIVALPAGIIAGGYMNELRRWEKAEAKKELERERAEAHNKENQPTGGNDNG